MNSNNLFSAIAVSQKGLRFFLFLISPLCWLHTLCGAKVQTVAPRSVYRGLHTQYGASAKRKFFYLFCRSWNLRRSPEAETAARPKISDSGWNVPRGPYAKAGNRRSRGRAACASLRHPVRFIVTTPQSTTLQY